MGHIYSITEVVGTSPNSVDEAVRAGLARANKTLRNLDWFEVTEIRGYIQDGAVGAFQVTMKVGFRLLDPDEKGNVESAAQRSDPLPDNAQV